MNKEGWKYKKFEDCISSAPKTSKILSSKYLKEGKYPIVSQEEDLISGYWNDECDVVHFDNPIVVFGDHTRKIKYIDFDFVVGADGVKILNPLPFINAKYFYYHLKWADIPSLGYSRHYKLLKDLEIPIPPLSEQEAIVAELDLLSSVIEKQKKQLEELDTLAQSIFYDMFGDPVENEKGWEVKKLADVTTDITDGDHMPPPKAETGIPFITISDIDKNTRTINFDNTYFVPQEYYDGLKENRKAKKGDLLYTVTGSYGIPVIVNTDKQFCFQRHIALIRPRQEILLTRFLCYWVNCKSIKAVADRAATGIAQKTVGLSSIRKFDIILPPLPLQQSFAEKIQAIEAQKAGVKAAMADTQRLFDYTMDKYFG